MRRCCSVGANVVRCVGTRQLYWQVQSSVIVERSPPFQPPPDPFIAKYQEMRATVQVERSVYNDFELETEKKKEDIIKERKQKFPPSNKYELPQYFSSADEQALLNPITNDRYIPIKPQEIDNKKSVQHTKPYSSIYLIVKSGDEWNFPQKRVEKEGSLEEAGVVALEKHPSNKDLTVQVSSRLPISVHVNKYSKRYQEHTNFTGVKTFFMKSTYQNGNFSGDSFMWCSKDELKDYVSKDILKCVEPCLK